jgi:glutamyl-tRNA synthetase
VEAGVTDVVRGDDLIDSVPRQRLIYEALGAGERVPRYYHLPLVVGKDGLRLAKRHGDTRIASLRAAGMSSAAVLQLLAGWCGMDARDVTRSADLVERFDLSRLPRHAVVHESI